MKGLVAFFALVVALSSVTCVERVTAETVTSAKFELFVEDADESIDFYQALGFEVVHRRSYGYTTLRNRETIVALSPVPHLAAALVSVSHPDGRPLARSVGLLLNAPVVDTSGQAEWIERRTREQAWLERRLVGPPFDVFDGEGPRYSPAGRIRSGELHAGFPPVLIQMGAEDPLLAPAREFCDALVAGHRPCRLIVYPDAGHGFALKGLSAYPDMVRESLAAIRGWLS